MRFIRERIGKLLEYLKDMVYTDEIPVKGCKMIKREEHFGDYANPDTTDWEEFGGSEIWGGHHEYYCFSGKVVVPDSMEGKCVVYELITGKEGEWDATNPQFSIYVNGRLVQGLDVNHREIVLCEEAHAGTEYDILLTAFSGDQNFHLLLDSKLKVLHRDIEKYYYDVNVPYQVAKLLPSDSKDYYNILSAVNESLNLLDIRVEHSKEFYESLILAEDYMQKNFYDKFCGGNAPVTYCVGHTHIDCAWMWTMSVTRDKAVRSFSTVLELMKAYPEYRFMSSQPLLYKFVKERAPEKYEEIKRRAAENRWEPEGGMYVEADCNLSSGEAFVRQILHGKRFFKEEFGVDNEILWLPDVFGYSAALPQILRKCGMKYFMTTKISWNETNKIPYDTFEWEGIDGSRVLTHFVPTRDYNAPAVDGGTATSHYTTYVGFLTPSHVMGGWERYSQKYLNNEVMMTYGYGDGGGGPTKEMLETARRLSKGIPGAPRTKLASAKEFFEKLDSEVSGKKYLPSWVGELYLEYHRGTYTSMARNKKYNRKSEFACINTELFSIINMVENNAEYPADELREAWELLLQNQFHDILPGSSIKGVYDDSKEEYEYLLAGTKKLTDKALTGLVKSIDAPCGSLIVFNPNGFLMTGETVFETELTSPAVYDNEVKLPIQKLSNGKYIFNAKNIPPKGYRSFEIREEISESIENGLRCTLGSNEYAAVLENAYFKICFDSKGRMSSIFDKRASREVLKDGELGNVIMTYEDRPHNFEAWDVNNYYEEKSWEADNVTGMEIVEAGEVITTLKIVREYLESTIIQYISIYKDAPRIDIRHEIDWKQKQILVKLIMPVDVHTSEASFEIQYGNVKRNTHYNTSWDAARFEVCMHKWMDVSEDNYGVSVLNDCKYGVSVHDGIIGVSLLKSAIYPNPDADKEKHEFTISLFPHEGGFKEAGTIKEAYLLNNPMTALVKENEGGSIPSKYSFVSSDCENVIVEAVKKAEDSDKIIVRLYECFNRRSDVVLTFADDIEEINECDMLENNISPVTYENSRAFIKIMPYEIKSFKIKLKNH